MAVWIGRVIARWREARLDGHHDERESADPDHGREEMEPVIHDGNELVQVKEDALYGIHDRWARADRKGSGVYRRPVSRRLLILPSHIEIEDRRVVAETLLSQLFH